MKDKLLNWKLTVGQVEQCTKEIIEKSSQVHNAIGNLPLAQCSYQTVIQPLAQLEAWMNERSVYSYFPQYVHPDPKLREVSQQCYKQLQKHDIELEMRLDVYERIKQVLENQKQYETAEQKRFVEKMAFDYQRNGLDLSPEKREQLKQLKTKLSELSSDFQRNINEDKTTLALTLEELEGMPDDYIQRLQKDDNGKYLVTMKYPDILPLLERAEKDNVRELGEALNTKRCEQNIQLLKEAISIRQQIASLLGFPNHAACQLKQRQMMAQNPKEIFDFLNHLKDKLQPLAKKEIQKLLMLQKEYKKLPQPNKKLASFDFKFYQQKLMQQDYQLNEEEIKQYFPLENVTKEMLKLFETVLNLKITKVSDLKEGDVWHEDVQVYQVQDAAHNNQLMGYFYLDLFPREGKYSHAACFGLRSGYLQDNKERQVPIAAMVANFTKPTASQPSLLKHSEVTTYFHELGHVMHQLCSQTDFVRFHGTKVERDFVEAPSQMLENWCWEEETLLQLSSHYKNTEQKLPREHLKSLLKTKNFLAGLLNLRQVFFATFDLMIHSEMKPDLDALWHQLKSDISLIEQYPGSFGYSTFGHLMGGYDVGYYGYLWSQVFSCDMFYSRFQKEGILNDKTGLDYRQKILKPGGSQDAKQMLHQFLGREPSAEPFLKSLGL